MSGRCDKHCVMSTLWLLIFASLSAAVGSAAGAKTASFHAQLTERLTDPRVRYVFKHIYPADLLFRRIGRELSCNDLLVHRPATLALNEEFNREHQWARFRQTLLSRIDLILKELDQITAQNTKISPRIVLDQLAFRHLSVTTNSDLLSRWQDRLKLKKALAFQDGPDPRFSYEPVPEISGIVADMKTSYETFQAELKVIEKSPLSEESPVGSNATARAHTRFGLALTRAESAFHFAVEHARHFEHAVEVERMYLGKSAYEREESAIRSMARALRDQLAPRWRNATLHLKDRPHLTEMRRDPFPEAAHFQELSRIADARVDIVSNKEELARFAEQLLRDFEPAGKLRN